MIITVALKTILFFGFLYYCETNEKHQKFGLLVVHTKCNRLGGLDNRNLLSHNLKFKNKVWVKSVLKRELVDMCSHNFLWSIPRERSLFFPLKGPLILSCVPAKSLQSCRTLCDPIDFSLPGSSLQGILQARILEWVAMPFSRVSS